MSDPFGISKIAPRIVYHGTDAKSALKIMRGGFKPNRSSRDYAEGRPAGVWVARNKHDVDEAAAYKSKLKGNKPARVTSMAVGPMNAPRKHAQGIESLQPGQLIPLSARPVRRKKKR